MTTQDLRLPEIRAERTARDLARINKRLGLVLLLVSIPYLLLTIAVILSIASGGFQVTFD